MRDLVNSPARRASFVDSGHWNDTTLIDRIRVHATAQPGSIAVVDRGGRRRTTYAELGRDVASLSQEMVATGVRQGDVVSIQLPNCYEAVVVAAATQAVGAVINPLLPTYRAHEVGHVYSTARPCIHVSAERAGTADLTAVVRDAANASGHQPMHVVLDLAATPPNGAWLAGAAAAFPERASSVDPDPAPVGQRVSELIFTSGTEATPKAVMHTENTANFSVRAAFDWLGLTAADSVWMPSPIGHSTGFNYGVRFALFHGLKLVLQDAWNASAAIELVDREQCSYTLAATTFLQDVVRLAIEQDVRLPSLRAFGCGGAPVPEALVRAADDRGITVLRLYGATEFLVATWNNHAASPVQRAQTDGNAIPAVQVAVRDDDGVDCDVGQPGEVYVTGPNNCVGFFADDDRTRATIDGDGWCRSGDLGQLDEAGYLTIVGRKKDMIIRGGMNIAPREIEDALLTFPEVWQAAIVGVPDDRLGERACACVVLRPDQTIDLAALTDRLERQGFAKYKLPEALQVFDAFPMTASGKVQKHELRKQIAGAHV